MLPLQCHVLDQGYEIQLGVADRSDNAHEVGCWTHAYIHRCIMAALMIRKRFCGYNVAELQQGTQQKTLLLAI